MNKYLYYPKNPDPSKVAILRTRTPAIQVQTLPLEGPRILRVSHIWIYNIWFGDVIQYFWDEHLAWQHNSSCVTDFGFQASFMYHSKVLTWNEWHKMRGFIKETSHLAGYHSWGSKAVKPWGFLRWETLKVAVYHSIFSFWLPIWIGVSSYLHDSCHMIYQGAFHRVFFKHLWRLKRIHNNINDSHRFQSRIPYEIDC